MQLRRFQKEFLKRALSPDVEIGALSLARGNRKSFLAGHILTSCLSPGDPLFANGQEEVQCAGSLEQARMVFGFVRQALEPSGEYRFIAELRAKLDGSIAINHDSLMASDSQGKARSFRSLVGGGMEIERAVILSGLMVADE